METMVIKNITTEYEVFDGCYGTVTGRCQKGAFITLDNGQEAFAFRYANLLPGTEVICTVIKKSKEDRRTLVSVDSIVRYAPLVA